MKKITGFKQKEDRIDRNLDRANNLNTCLNRFSLETSSPSSSPAPKQTSHHPLIHSFPVTSQLSHLPPRSWILLLLHCCVQPHQGMLGPLTSLCTPQTSSTSQSPVIYRNTQMTLWLWGVSVMDQRLSSENWWTALWHSVGTIIECAPWEK